jgi:hypothetical protein
MEITDRANCMMCQVVGGEIYCDYYDFMCMKCEEVTDCPEEEAYEVEDEDNYEIE